MKNALKSRERVCNLIVITFIISEVLLVQDLHACLEVSAADMRGNRTWKETMLEKK